MMLHTFTVVHNAHPTLTFYSICELLNLKGASHGST